MAEQKARTRISTGNPYERKVGYSRAIRIGDQVSVGGTTAVTADGEIIGVNDPYQQTRQALKTIQWALEQAGANLDDVFRYRAYLTRADDLPEVSRALSETFQSILPINTVVIVAALADPRMLVEIEADALIGSAAPVSESPR